MGGFKFPIDIDDDGVLRLSILEPLHPIGQATLLDANIDVIELAFDNDNDGIINQNDSFPNDPNSYSADSQGKQDFFTSEK